MRTYTLMVLATSVLFTVGCNRSAEQSGSVAIVDLDQVAAQLGSDARILAAVKGHETTLNQQLAAAKASYENQLRATQKNFGSQPSPEQTQQLNRLKQQANQQLKQVAQQAKGNLQQHRAQLLLQFRDEAKQAARQVAHEQNLSMVVTKNDAVVLVYNEAVDITSEVTERMQTAAPVR
jgi:Skp family chaperone for outer membrane proteins